MNFGQGAIVFCPEDRVKEWNAVMTNDLAINMKGAHYFVCVYVNQETVPHWASLHSKRHPEFDRTLVPDLFKDHLPQDHLLRRGASYIPEPLWYPRTDQGHDFLCTLSRAGEFADPRGVAQRGAQTFADFCSTLREVSNAVSRNELMNFTTIFDDNYDFNDEYD